MSTSKTAEAAAKAVAKSQKANKTERTPEHILADLRRNLSAGLAVTPDDQRFLLSAYDAAFARATELGVQVETLQNSYNETASLVSILEDGKTRYLAEISELTAKLWSLEQSVTAAVQTAETADSVHPTDLHRLDDDGAPAQ